MTEATRTAMILRMAGEDRSCRTLRERLAGREFLLGSFNVEFLGQALPHALAQAGFDLVIVDTEHSSFGLIDVAQHVTASRAAGIASIIRVAENSRSAITRAAELWPDGIMFPGVECEDEARRIVAASKYAPLGQRGICPMVQYMSLPAGERYTIVNDRLALVLQLEGRHALAQAPRIASVTGVDAVFVGTYDLSQSLGIPGQLDDPRVFNAANQLLERLPENVALGFYTESPESARRWLDAGATFVAFSTDGQLFLGACRQAAASVVTARS
jgi:4-hydroxy-2-oxoheptanedioate aldolase